MDSLQIEKILYSNKYKFNGVYPCDMIPTPQTYPTAYIVNNKDSSDPGEHWVALYIKNSKLVYYFDSLALKPNPLFK